MSSGWTVGNIIAISRLAIKVHTAYHDAPDDYRDISQEVAALQVLIDRVVQHFENIPIGSSICHGEKILKGCQSVLEDLHSLIKKYDRLASTNCRLTFKLGKEDVMALRERLISSTVLLNGFVRRFVVPGILLHAHYINIHILVTSILRHRHSWLLSLAFNTPVPESQ